MSRTPFQFKQMKDERMLSITKAALPLFSLYGKEKVSVDMITKSAKCSHGLFYHYYKDVSSIYDIIMSSSSSLELKGMLLDNDKSELATKKIIAKVHLLIDVAASDINMISIANIIIKEKGKHSFFELLSTLLKQGQKEGDIVGGDPHDIALAIITIVRGLYEPQLLNKKEKITIPSKDIIDRLYLKR